MKLIHYEDLYFTHTPDEIYNLTREMLVDMLESTKAFKTKWDGVCVVMGIDRRGFYVASKKFFNKRSSIRYYSEEDIEQSTEHPEMQKKLLEVFSSPDADRFQRHSWPKGNDPYMVGDFIAYKEDYIGKTNIIEYDLTTFCTRFRYDYLSEPQVVWHTSNLDISLHSNVYPFTYIIDIFDRCETDFSEAIDFIYRVLSKADRIYRDEKENLDGISSQINVSLRDTDNSLEQILENLLMKPDGFYGDAYYSIKNMIDIKKMFIEYHTKHRKQFIQTSYQGKPFPHEGYVWRNIKFIDREVFSRINFREDSYRGWSR